MHPNPLSPDALLRIRQIVGDPAADPPVPALINVSRSTWWSWCARKIAPAPVRIAGATFWRASEVLELAAQASNDVPASSIGEEGSACTGRFAQLGKGTDGTSAPSADKADWKAKLRARKGAQA